MPKSFSTCLQYLNVWLKHRSLPLTQLVLLFVLYQHKFSVFLSVQGYVSLYHRVLNYQKCFKQLVTYPSRANKTEGKTAFNLLCNEEYFCSFTGMYPIHASNYTFFIKSRLYSFYNNAINSPNLPICLGQ